jgi:hypothetical protein
MIFPGGTISMTASDPAIDIFPSGSYEVFLTDNTPVRISENGVAIPEISSLFLFLAGMTAAGVRFCRVTFP